MIKIFTIGDALSSLCPGIEWSIYGNDYNSLIFHNGEAKPTLEQLNNEVARLQADYDAKLYQRQRQPEYPPITDYLDAVVKNDTEQMQAYIDACLAVKAKYPKPE